MNALEMGRRVLGGTMEGSAENLGIQLADMSDEARGYFQQGVGEGLLARVREQGGPNAVRQLLRNSEFQDRIRLAFPSSQAYDDFVNAMTREADIAARGQQIMTGSPTARRQAVQGMLQGQSIAPKVAELATATGAGAAIGGPAGAAGGGLGFIVRELVRGAGQRGRERASLLNNEETNRLLAEVLVQPDKFRDLLTRAQAGEQIPGFSRRASALLAEVLAPRAGALAPLVAPEPASTRRQASQ
jgi:hypothetical protein